GEHSDNADSEALWLFRIRIHPIRFYLRRRRRDCQRAISWPRDVRSQLAQILAHRLDRDDAFRLVGGAFDQPSRRCADARGLSIRRSDRPNYKLAIASL